MKAGRFNLFIERSLKSAIDFLKEAVFSEEIAHSKGLLQSLGPRLKIILMLAFVATASFARTIPLLAALYILSIILAALSSVNIWFFIKRVWVFIPIFTLFIIIPVLFMGNLFSATIFVLRVATSVSFVVLFTLTTKHGTLLKSLRALGVPAVFIQVLDMTYRYVFLLIKIFEEMHLSLKARTIKKFGPKEASHWIASRMAFLFKKSVRMSEDVYFAMIARGYTGEAEQNGR